MCLTEEKWHTCAPIFAGGTLKTKGLPWELMTQAHHVSRMQEHCNPGWEQSPVLKVWLIAEESLLMVAECIMRMFTLGLGSDLTYLRRHLTRHEEWSTRCTWAERRPWEGRSTQPQESLLTEGSWGRLKNMGGNPSLAFLECIYKLLWSWKCVDYWWFFKFCFLHCWQRKQSGNFPRPISFMFWEAKEWIKMKLKWLFQVKANM